MISYVNLPFPFRSFPGKIVSVLLQQPLRDLVASHHHQVVRIPDDVVRRGHHAHLLLMFFLNAEYGNLVRRGYVGLPDALAHPLLERGHLVDPERAGQVDVVEDVVEAVALRPLLRDVLIRVDHLVRPVAQQKLRLDVPRRLADHPLCPELLHKACDLQTALEVGADAHKHDIKIPDADTFQDLLARAVADPGARRVRNHVLELLLVLIHDHDIVPVLQEISRQVMSETPHSYD